MRKSEQLRLQRKKDIGLWSFIALATLIFLAIVCAMIIENVEYRSYKNISKKGLTILGSEMFSLTDGDYYIFVYSSDDDNNRINMNKQNELEVYIVNYFNFVKQNKRKGNICEMRLLDIEESKNKRCLGSETTTNANSWSNFTIEESSLPALIYMEVESNNGSYNYSYDIYTKASDIKEKLSNSISLTTTSSYLPLKKKEELV